MKLTFFSNFMNHHQLLLCLELVELLGDNFKFVATKKIDDYRIEMGYEDMNSKYDFIVRSYEEEKIASELASESDIIIIGSAPDKYAWKGLKNGKIVIRYSERVFRNGFKLKTFISLFLKRTILERNNTFLLCSSAFAAYDYNLAGAFRNKTYKWGYFPEIKYYKSINQIIKKKHRNSLLWTARFIDLKHPEIPIEIARRLKKDKYDFILKMIGIGELYSQIETLINEYGLEDNVKLLGSMSPEEVRYHMEKSEIFLFTSDKREGWGAVLNESMNSACAVLASHEIGSVPFLINDKFNGLVYEDGNIDDLYNKVKFLLDNNSFVSSLGANAYNTMITLWNPKIAAKRLIELSDNLLNKKAFNKYKEGPCSKAVRLNNKWYIKE